MVMEYVSLLNINIQLKLKIKMKILLRDQMLVNALGRKYNGPTWFFNLRSYVVV